MIKAIDLENFVKGHPIAIYGLAANPPHRGHWGCIQNLVSRGYKVLVVPSYSHAFGKKMAPFDLRVKWLRMAGVNFQEIKDFFLIWDIEKELYKDGAPIYSIDLLDYLKRTVGISAVLAVGPDNAKKEVFSKFKNYEKINSEYGVVVVPEAIDIRSTWIRTQIKENRPEFVKEYLGEEIFKEVVNFFASNNH